MIPENFINVELSNAKTNTRILNLKRLCLQKLKIKSCKVLDKSIKLPSIATANRIHNAS